MVADFVDEDVGDQFAKGHIPAIGPFIQDRAAIEHDAVGLGRGVGDGLLGQVDTDIDAGELERVIDLHRFQRLSVGKVGNKHLDAAAHVAKGLGQAVEGVDGELLEILERGGEKSGNLCHPAHIVTCAASVRPALAP